jgi:hypothetical protein
MTLPSWSVSLVCKGCRYSIIKKKGRQCRCAQIRMSCEGEIFSHILLRDEACFTREDVFNVHNGHWAQADPHSIRERGYQVRFSFSVWAVTVGNTFIGPYLLPDRLIAGNCSACAAWKRAPRCQTEVVVTERRNSSALWGHARQWLNTTYQGRGIECRGPNDGRLSRPT